MEVLRPELSIGHLALTVSPQAAGLQSSSAKWHHLPPNAGSATLELLLGYLLIDNQTVIPETLCPKTVTGPVGAAVNQPLVVGGHTEVICSPRVASLLLRWLKSSIWQKTLAL